MTSLDGVAAIANSQSNNSHNGGRTTFFSASFKTLSTYLLSCHQNRKKTRRESTKGDVHEYDIFNFSFPLSAEEAFILSLLSFVAHNSVWNSPWPIVNYRTGCPFERTEKYWEGFNLSSLFSNFR